MRLGESERAIPTLISAKLILLNSLLNCSASGSGAKVDQELRGIDRVLAAFNGRNKYKP